MIRTPLCELAGIRFPIFQGGMAHVSDGKLAAAVSEAGGLGIVSAMNYGGTKLREQIREARSLTAKPIGVNIMLQAPTAADSAAICAEEKVEIVTTGAGNPAEFMPLWLDAGIRVIPVVASAALAKMMERAGASAVIAEGGESGGHIGEAATMPLVPQVVDAVSIPVIAAGGIADGRGLAAALMLGAAGVQMGTRFLVAKECGVPQHYKDLILKASDTSTIVTGRRLGHTVRSLKTPYSRHYAQVEYTDISDEELEALGVGSLRRAAIDGDEKGGCYLAGQIAGMVKAEQTAAEILEDVMRGAETALASVAAYLK
ncbi:MAG: nitronate monooxygenase [Clostridia bacterium]|nr:nitronate monooxygenase [Clostridia bacterium]MBR5365728.1 nitronate monooxygenase [Clostridia bacterium]